MDMEVARAFREALGPDFTLMHDPVQTYTYSEAVRVGRAPEELNFKWLEEPLQEYDLPAYQKLCQTLDLPIAAAEWVFGGPHAVATRLAMGAADIVRRDAVVSGGITGLILLFTSVPRADRSWRPRGTASSLRWSCCLPGQ